MSTYASTYREHREAAERYYDLTAEARALGVPTDLDDPESPSTVEALALEVAAVKATRARALARLPKARP